MSITSKAMLLPDEKNWCIAFVWFHLSVYDTFAKVGVPVDKPIYPMHEKSCIGFRNAWKFEKKTFIIQSFTYLLITLKKCEIITNMDLIKWSYVAIIQQVIRSRIRIWNVINFMEDYRRTIKNKLPKYFPFTHICVHIICWLNDTEIIMAPQMHCCYALALQDHAEICLQCTVPHHREFENHILTTYHKTAPKN